MLYLVSNKRRAQIQRGGGAGGPDRASEKSQKYRVS